MEYTIRELSGLAGISTRTLRYYDQIGLLSPVRMSESGYRIYGQEQLKLLQQILFYKERGLNLTQIKEIVYNPEFDAFSAMEEHLSELIAQKQRISRLITAVEKTMASMKGEITMSVEEKFEVFKKELVERNEAAYGEEVHSKYGDEKVEESNRQLLNMSEEEYNHFKELEAEILKKLAHAVNAGESPEGEEAGKIVKLHKEWLEYTWTQYTPQAHRGVAAMYTADERFKAYYDDKAAGCADFLKSAVDYWTEK